jgi:hypothetical protein
MSINGKSGIIKYVWTINRRELLSAVKLGRLWASSLTFKKSLCPYALYLFLSPSLSLPPPPHLAPQPSLGLGLLHKIRLNFLEASQQFSFLQVRVVSPAPNPHPGGPGLCIYIPRGRVAQLYPQALGIHFSRLLRHAWVTVGLFLFPGHHTGSPILMTTLMLILFCLNLPCIRHSGLSMWLLGWRISTQ